MYVINHSSSLSTQDLGGERRLIRRMLHIHLGARPLPSGVVKLLLDALGGPAVLTAFAGVCREWRGVATAPMGAGGWLLAAKNRLQFDCLGPLPQQARQCVFDGALRQEALQRFSLYSRNGTAIVAVEVEPWCTRCVK